MPKRREVRILAKAKEDFTEIMDYISLDKPSAAHALADRIESSINHLVENPQLGRLAREKNLAQLGYRYLIVGGYLIFYTYIEDEDIIIHRILHSARDYGRILG